MRLFDLQPVRRHRPVSAALALCLLAGLAWAQPPAEKPATDAKPATKAPRPDPANDPALNDPSLEEDVVRPRGAVNPGTIPSPETPEVPSTGAAPVRPVSGLPALGPGVPKGQFLSEGTFLSGKPGAIVKSPSGNFLFVPTVPEEGQAKAIPMALLHNQRLSQVASIFDTTENVERATVSGQAFVYHGKQYLLLSVFSIAADTGTTVPAGQLVPLQPSLPAIASTDVQDMMKELDAKQAAPRATDQRLLTPDTPAGRVNKDSVIAEGTVVTSRRARLVRGPSGLSATFDNGPGNANLPAMPLLPCRVLEQMESLAASRGENLVIRLSGRATVHENRNYLLPTMYQVIRPGDVKPLQ